MGSGFEPKHLNVLWFFTFKEEIYINSRLTSCLWGMDIGLIFFREYSYLPNHVPFTNISYSSMNTKNINRRNKGCLTIERVWVHPIMTL
jgi:hypothetical protein